MGRYMSGAKKGQPCTRKAYYMQDRMHLCGIHSAKGARTDLPANPRAAEIKAERIAAHTKSWKLAAKANRGAGKHGDVKCDKLRMYAPAPHKEGYLTVFPNSRHQNRTDGFGCAALSPMCLGPVAHGQPGLPDALNLENFHQGSKCFDSELIGGEPGPRFFEAQLAMFLDPKPHRRKDVAKYIGVEKYPNECAFWVWIDPATGARKLFSYAECRQFYCNYYERLAAKQPDLAKLTKLLTKGGCNLLIIGYDGLDVVPPEGTSLRKHLMSLYEDESRPFGHELILFTMLTCKPAKYPWRLKKTEKF
jgi:hypothetical protein